MCQRVKYYCPSHIYAAISYYTIFLFLASYDISAAADISLRPIAQKSGQILIDELFAYTRNQLSVRTFSD